ncbi:MAG TPA: hypothetical protein PKM35_07950 [Holophaga sp.]|nr:hypothetical protein [Holophaga sp.]HPS68216.1 hypothetical protein [Holophaga sp.]
MPGARLLLRALHFGLLLAAAAGIMRLHPPQVTPGLAFVVLAVYAHGAARVFGAAGTAKALCFLEILPFFAFAVVQPGGSEPSAAWLGVVSGAAAGAAILGCEWLLSRGKATFGTSLGFIGACCLAGWGMSVLPAGRFLGLTLLALTGSGYGLARRARG